MSQGGESRIVIFKFWNLDVPIRMLTAIIGFSAELVYSLREVEVDSVNTLALG